MTYTTVEEVKQLSGVTPESLKLPKGDNEALTSILTGWINQCKSLIDAHCHTSWENEVPGAVQNVCLRMASNMVALAQARKDTPLVKVNDWSVKIVDFNIFTQDLKNDLKPFVKDESNISDSVEFQAITGD